MDGDDHSLICLHDEDRSTDAKWAERADYPPERLAPGRSRWTGGTEAGEGTKR